MGNLPLVYIVNGVLYPAVEYSDVSCYASLIEFKLVLLGVATLHGASALISLFPAHRCSEAKEARAYWLDMPYSQRKALEAEWREKWPKKPGEKDEKNDSEDKKRRKAPPWLLSEQ